MTPHEVRALLSHIGEEDREGLAETPERYLKALDQWFSGYRQDATELIKSFQDGSKGVDQMVVETDIPVYSHCEHHIAPIFGVAHVAYIPCGFVLGLSKMARVVEVFARRLQVQERLTQQIGEALYMNIKKCQGVAVMLQCRHMCMESRGVSRPGIVTTTSALFGDFYEDYSTRQEFMSIVSMTAKRPVL